MRPVNEAECRAAGVSPQAVREIALLLDRAASLAKRIGVTIFGGAHSGDLRKHVGDGVERAYILAQIPGPFDGGDGGNSEDDNGFLRGE